jgi:hypothetical protein
MRRSFGIAAFIIFCISLQTPAVAKPSDDEIRSELIGSWIVPADSTDRTPQTDLMIETFRSDGTYTGYIFQDSACRILVKKIEVRWNVENGVLTSIYESGGVDHDEVIGIEHGKMTLHNLGDGSTYTRVKAKTCSKGLI